jgi:hypothetical protein
MKTVSASLLAVLVASMSFTPQSIRSLNDEFNDTATLSNFTDLFPNRHEALDINTSTPGHLTIVPVAAPMNHWFSDNQGPMIYKMVTGNFVVETLVRVGRRSDPTQPPRGQFNAAGFVIRDARSLSPGGQMWVMYNLGYQASSFAREIKTTRPNAAGASLSTLYLNNAPPGVYSAWLRVCRVGNTFHFFYRHPGAMNWIEEVYTSSTMVQGNGANQPTPGTMFNGPLRFDRPDLSPMLQIGLIAGNWLAPLEVRAEFDYIRFYQVTTLADCTADFPF